MASNKKNHSDDALKKTTIASLTRGDDMSSILSPSQASQENRNTVLTFANHFKLVGILAILVATSLIAVADYYNSINFLTTVSETHNVSLAHMMVNHIDHGTVSKKAQHSHDDSYAIFTESASQMSADALRRHPRTMFLEETINSMTDSTPILAVKLYLPSGLTLYSPEASEIGSFHPNADNFAEAALGSISSAITLRGDSAHSNSRVLDRDVVESYVPIVGHHGPAPRFIFEMYYDVTHDMTALQSSLIFTVCAAAATLLGVFAMLAYVVRPADRIMRHQYQQNLWLTNAVEKTASMVLITDTDGKIKYVNQRFCKVTGYAKEDAIGATPAILRSDETPTETYRQLWATLNAGEIWKGEILNRKRDGSTYWEYQTITPIRDADGEIYEFIAIKEDITENKSARARIDHLAMFDSLTELPNRTHFMDRLAEGIAHAKRSQRQLGVIFVDLDDFKDVNDTLGHHAGDVILREAARRMATTVREIDIIARIGGDEFAILANQLDHEGDAASVAERLIASVQPVFSVDSTEVFIGASVGIAIFPCNGDNGEQLLRNADLALYRSKEQGRNTYHFYEAEMDTKVLQSKLLAKDLHKALAKEELELFYQPLVEMNGGKLIAFEALLRWHHPVTGLIEPKAFIPIAENTRLIVPIGEWVLFEACRENCRLRQRGIADVPMAVNLSPIQFQHTDLPELVQRVLTETGLPADRLVLEITESVAMSDAQAIELTLQQLRQLGVHISLDDFGTGFSSLSHLSRLPIDKIKIDRSFLPEKLDNAQALAVIEAIYQLSTSLNKEVVIEGVENADQVAYLIQRGFNAAQGFYYARPVPASEIAALINQGEIRTAVPNTATTA
jgi:diguanylate cyclase (GGDEF)-like protein/PAS domain S-box-containing protein